LKHDIIEKVEEKARKIFKHTMGNIKKGVTFLMVEREIQVPDN